MSDPSPSQHGFPQQELPQAQPVAMQMPAAKPVGNSNTKYILGCLALVVVFSILGFIVLGGTIAWLLVVRDDTQVVVAPQEITNESEAGASAYPGEEVHGESAAIADQTGTSGNRKLRPLQPLNGLEIAKTNSQYRFDWKKIQKFQTVFTFKTEMTRQQNLSFRGSTTYSYSEASADSLIKDQQNSGETESTGTGFVVHSGGAVLTCAHVVGSAEEVDVLIGKEKVTGKVVAIDQNLDLAIVRIPTAGRSRPYLSFAPANTILQGAQIQVLGFPLSDSLGESIKVNSGAISGFGDGENGRSIQIDATVNPGNSGGPVIDRSGRVIGIADAMLAGGGINPIGFAIPQERAISFLQKHNVDVNVNANGSQGGDIIGRVKQSVVLLKVTGADTGSATVLEYESNFFYGNDYRTEEGKTVVDGLGNVLFTTGDEVIPVLSKHVSTLGIETLPPGGNKTWQDRQMMLIEKTERTESPNDRYGRLGGYPYNRLYGSSQVREKTYQIPVVETTKHTLKSSSDSALSISKFFRLEAASEEYSEKFPGIDLDGTYDFDVKSGNLKSGSFSGKTVLVSGNASIKVPFTFSFTIKNVETVEREEAEANARYAETKRKANEKERELARLKSSRLDKFDPEK